MGLIQPERYPRLTLVRQALGSVALGWEALRQVVPEVRPGGRGGSGMACGVWVGGVEASVPVPSPPVLNPFAPFGLGLFGIGINYHANTHTQSLRFPFLVLSTTCTQVYIDTTGWAFPYPLAWRAGAAVVAYVHYPTISSDMLAAVWAGSATAVSNDADIAGGVEWVGGCGCVGRVEWEWSGVEWSGVEWEWEWVQGRGWVGAAGALVVTP